MNDYMKEAERLLDEIYLHVSATVASALADEWAEVEAAQNRSVQDRAALLAHIQRGVPEGWQLVPINHTPEMRAAWDGAPDSEDDDMAFHFGYRAMLAAAPDHFRDDTTASEKISEQSAFEDWLEKKSPSGDSESVQRQWERSSEFEDWLLDQEREAAAPNQFRDAAKMMAEPAEVPMPEPTVSTYEGYRDSSDEWHAMAYSHDQMRTYGDAREAAGYARGLAEAGRDAKEWGKALNDAGWAFDSAYHRHMGEPTPPRLFKTAKTILRDAIIAYTAAMRGEVKP